MKKVHIKPFSTKTTYFLLSRDEAGQLADFIGPLLFEEIDEAKEEFLTTEFSSLEVMDELYFKTIFTDHYYADFYDNWFMYLEYHLSIVHGLEVKRSNPIFPVDSDEEEFALIISNVGVIYRHQDVLNVSFFIDADPAKTAEVFHNIHTYVDEVYDMKIQPSIYYSEQSPKPKIYFGRHAYKQKKHENLLNICLN